MLLPIACKINLDLLFHQTILIKSLWDGYLIVNNAKVGTFILRL